MPCIKDVPLYSRGFPLVSLYEALKDTCTQSTYSQASQCVGPGLALSWLTFCFSPVSSLLHVDTQVRKLWAPSLATMFISFVASRNQ